MERDHFINLDLKSVPSPAYVINTQALEENLKVLNEIQTRTGVKILLALKGFATTATFPLIQKYLEGACASSPHEAKLGREKIKKEVHSFAPAYSEEDLNQLCKFSDHIVFNSFYQWEKFQDTVQKNQHIQWGLRVNPEHSETEVEIYDPCAPLSRLGITFDQFKDKNLNGISGLHLHTLCQKGAEALERTLDKFENLFRDILPKINWLNLGGGHYITHHDYNIDLLFKKLIHLKKTYQLQIYLEPGEAVAYNCGALVTTILDIVHNQRDIAILDCSATCHMPDVLEMPYRPKLKGAAELNQHPYNYRLGGLSCLAGDIIGDYSFPNQLQVGDRLCFLDMAQYTMVKTTTFNGVKLPSIVLYDPSNHQIKTVRKFEYQDYLSRLE